MEHELAAYATGMQWISRRRALGFLGWGVAAFWMAPSRIFARDSCVVSHPLSPPDPRFSGNCPNCGMGRAMWARTWVTYVSDEVPSEVCSFHCLADMGRKSGRVPENVRVALYLRPERMLSAEEAVFVVGSRAKGTMSPTSKAAFASRKAAEGFVAVCGGKMLAYKEALAIAEAGLPEENQVIARRRVDAGKISIPVDNRDRCAVCEMFPSRYPRHRCQVRLNSGQAVHFCSTRCLFQFLHNRPGYRRAEEEIAMIWVSDYETGAWVSAYTAYYAVGANAWGPMGHEAFSFDTLNGARQFVGERGGDILPFSKVSIDRIRPRP